MTKNHHQPETTSLRSSRAPIRLACSLAITAALAVSLVLQPVQARADATPPAESAAALPPLAAALPPLAAAPGANPGVSGSRYLNQSAGYSIPLPSGWRVDESKAPVVVRLVGPAGVVDVFDQKLNGISASEYILYSNRSVTNEWNGHKLIQQGAVKIAGRDAYHLEWLRPPLSLVSPDLRHYAEWHVTRDADSVLTFMLKATEAGWAEARQAAERMVAGLQWLPRSGSATWQLPQVPARDWTPWQDRTALKWRMPPAGQLMWGMYDPRFEMKSNLFQLEDFARFEKDELGTRLGLIMTYMNYGRPFQDEIMERATRDGRLMLLTVQTNPGDDVRSDAIYRNARTRYYRLLDGKDDDYLREFARAARRFGKPFLFRFDNEMNGDWTAWSAFQYGKDTDLYIAAWRHAREIFRAEGADNAIWVWNPNCDSLPRFAWNRQSRYWPGADAVDLVGLTCYNTAGSPEKWRSFEQLYRPLYQEYMQLYGDKPFLITEFSSHTAGGEKPRWVREMFDSLATMPNIRMAVWWNGADNVGNYWLTEPRDALLAFREGIRAPRFVNTVTYGP